MFRLDEKVAVVVGAAHGIGRAIAETFASAGASVLMTDIDEQSGQSVADEIVKQGSRAKFLRADAGSAEDARRVADFAVSGLGGSIHILCYNAAFLKNLHESVRGIDDEWETGYRVTLLGAQNHAKAILPIMISQRTGSIINISSIQGIVGCPDSASYTAFKAGMIGLTRSIAYDYGPHNVRANAICPGPIRTRISPEEGSDAYLWQVNNTMLRRPGCVSDVAHTALFLASDEASYITGISLPVDGGWTAI